MSEPNRPSFNLEYHPPRDADNPENHFVPNELTEQFEEIQENGNGEMEEEFDDATPTNNNQIEDSALLDELEKEFRITHDPETGAKLLEAYKGIEDFENVRRVRESILEHSILTEKNWLDWLDDEINNAKTDEEKKGVLKLIDRALDESLFFDVAKLGINYVKGLYNNGIVRKQGAKITMEKIINAFLFDFNTGSKFFKKLRKFELGNTEVKNEADREKTIRSLYERQLKLPYADIQQAMTDYVNWEKNEDERKKMIKIYEDTYKTLGTHLDFEDKFQESVDSSDPDQLIEVLQEIIDSEELKLEKKLNFFERYIVANPEEPRIWEKYCEFADKNIQSASALERIYRRANKACPGNMYFTKGYLRVLEKVGTEPEKLKEKIISMQWNFRTSADFYFLRLQLCEVYVRVLNAKLIEVKGNVNEAKEEVIRFRQAIQEAIQFFSSDLSPEHQAYIADLWLFKAHIETYTIKDKQQMNQSMDKYVQLHGSQYLAWSQYVTFEQALGRPDTVRKVLKRGCEYTKDDISAMFALAIDFERKFGSLEELQNTEKRLKEKKEKLAQEDPNNAGLIGDTNEIIPKQLKPKKVDTKKVKDRKDKEGTGKRRSKGDEDQNKEFQHERKLVKKTEPDEGKRAMEEEKQQQDNEDVQTENKKEANHPSHKEILYPEELDKKNTVFVRNFPPTFSTSDVSSLFTNFDKITGCRFGKTKGIAYVDFLTEEDAKEACSANIKIDGQQLEVALSDTRKKGSDDKQTLFVNNLPFDITQETLNETFKKWKDHIKEIRIPTHNDNKPKGFALIVFDSENVPHEVIDQNKDLHIGGRKIHLEHADSKKKYQNQNIKALHVAFIKNLSFKVTENDMLEFFKDYTVKQVHLVKDKNTQKPTGIAFVEFATLEDLKSAIAIPEPTILGRKIDISKSNRPITQSHTTESHDTKPKKKSLSYRDVQKTEEPAAAPAAGKQNLPVPTQIRKPVAFIAAKTNETNSNTVAATAPINTETTNNPAMKSNNDFKALFLKKK